MSLQKDNKGKLAPNHLNTQKISSIFFESGSGRHPKVFIKTFGCQMNDRDSEALLGIFLDRGYCAVDKPEEADVILVNTCSVRGHAEERAISFLGSLKKLTAHSSLLIDKNKNLSAKNYELSANPIVGLIGCMARNRGEEIFRKMPHVDLVCGPAGFAKIAEYIDKIRNSKSEIRNKRKRIIDTDDYQREESFYQADFREDSLKAQVIISTGCFNNCSYCIVPYVRGLLRPRAPEVIIEEVKRNAATGRRRITLLGQNVNDYCYEGFDRRPGKGVVSFVDLLRMAAAVPGVADVDFITAHPKNTSFDLLYFMAESNRIVKRLHLPFQSGSNRILKLMNRGYTREDYLTLILNYKKIVKGSLSTDVIVGFPGETEDDFKQTRQIIEEVRFKTAYIFKYSPRPGTAAAKLPDDVPEDVKKRRHGELLGLQKKISLKKSV